MNFEITGKLFEIYPTNQKTDKFRSREFVLETTKTIGERTATDYVKFQTTNDKCDLLNKYNVGSEVTVHFNIRGNRWEKEGKVKDLIDIAKYYGFNVLATEIASDYLSLAK